MRSDDESHGREAVNPATVFNALLKSQQAGLLRALELWQRPAAAGDENDDAGAQPSGGATPHEVVHESGTLRLRHYLCPGGGDYREPILICYALVNRPYILDLQQERSVVQRLLDHRHDVYLIDWGVPAPEDHTRRLEDYVCGLLHEVVEVVCRRSACEQLNLFGYCMGGTMSAMYTALLPERVRNLILMAAPIDFGPREGLLNIWADPKYFDVDGLIDAFGNCPGELLQYCFQLLRPVQNFHEKYMTFVEKMDDEEFLANFLAMERWTNDNIPVAGETFRQFVKDLYQRNLLVQGRMHLGERRVDLQKIACPLLLITAEYDHLVPPCCVLALADYVSSRDIRTLSSDVGHVGLAVSRKAHSQLWPAACQWIADHSSARHSSAPRREETRVGEGESDARTHTFQTAESDSQRSATMSENNDTFDALRRSAFFQNVADEHLKPLAEIAKVVEYPARKTIFAEFEKARDVYVVVSGEVSVVVCEPKVGCRQLATVRGGELLGWSPMLEHQRLTATAVTLTPTKAIVIDGHELVELCKKDPAVGYEFMTRTAQVLAERLHATRVQLLDISGSHLPEITLESD